MRALIVESEVELGRIWQRHLQRQGVETVVVHDQGAAIETLRGQDFDVIVLDLILPGGSAFAVSDYASYRQPRAQVIFVTSSGFFSDGSIFAHCANARAMFPHDGPPADLAAMVQHYGTTG